MGKRRGSVKKLSLSNFNLDVAEENIICEHTRSSCFYLISWLEMCLLFWKWILRVSKMDQLGGAAISLKFPFCM